MAHGRQQPGGVWESYAQGGVLTLATELRMGSLAELSLGKARDCEALPSESSDPP